MNAGGCVEAEFYPKSSGKGIHDPLNAMAIGGLHQYRVEATGRNMGELGQVMLCAAYQLGLLARVDAGSRTTKRSIAAQAYLNKNKNIFLLADQVNLAKAAAVIALQQLQPLLEQELRSHLLGLRTCSAHFAGVVVREPAAALRAAISAAFSAALVAFREFSASGVRPRPYLI